MNVYRSLSLSVVAVATLFASDAEAGASFRMANAPEVQVFCDLATISGRYDPRGPQYTSAGTCTGMTSPGGVSTPGSSEFPDTAHSTEIFAPAGWTAVATYNATTKETVETITLPAPNIDQPSPPSRPYGHFSATMICTTDPWLDATASCTGFRITATGNLGVLETALRQSTRPFSSQTKPTQHQALIDAAQRAQQNRLGVTAAGRSAAVLVQPPEIVSPAAGSTQRMASPLAVRIAAARVPVQGYQLEFQKKDAGGAWQPVATLPATPAQAESSAGFRADGSAALKAAGSYRLRASADGGPASVWREYDVTVGTAIAATAAGPWSAVTQQPSSTPATRVPTVPPRPTPAWGNVPSAFGGR